jgi:hypothetical protein
MATRNLRNASNLTPFLGAGMVTILLLAMNLFSVAVLVSASLGYGFLTPPPGVKIDTPTNYIAVGVTGTILGGLVAHLWAPNGDATQLMREFDTADAARQRRRTILFRAYAVASPTIPLLIAIIEGLGK